MIILFLTLLYAVIPSRDDLQPISDKTQKEMLVYTETTSQYMDRGYPDRSHLSKEEY